VGKKLVAGLIVLVVVLTSSARAEASGVITHSWMALRAVPLVSDPDLRALLQAHLDQVESGAHFPDSGYANPLVGTSATYGEEAHWPRFSNAYADQIRDDPRCGDLTDPNGPCATRIAHLLGAVGHGMGDEVWDWLFEPNAPDRGESYIPPDLAGYFGTGGIELQMDMIAIGDYSRATSPELPPWPSRRRLDGVFDSVGRPDITGSDLRAGERSMSVVRAGDRLLAGLYHDDITRNMPWTSANIVTAPGGIRFAATAIAAAWESLWGRMLGEQPPTEVAITYPAAGEVNVPVEGWDREDFAPGSAAYGGGARTRITAVLNASLPYVPLAGDSGHVPSELPDGAMTLTEAATGAPVPVRSGYPRLVPYGPDSGEHTIDIQPDADLDPCTEYRVDVTDALLDANGAPVVPMSWTFQTRGCPGPAARADTQIKTGAGGAFVGSNVYTADGAGQARTATVARGSSATFYLKIQNDGDDVDDLTVTGQRSLPTADVRYFAGNTDVSSRVKAGTFRTGGLAPGASTSLRMVITAASNGPPATTVIRRVRATSANDPAAVDAVRARVATCQGPACGESGGSSASGPDPTLELTDETLSTMAAVLTCNLR